MRKTPNANRPLPRLQSSQRGLAKKWSSISIFDTAGFAALVLQRREIGPDLFRHACLMGLEGLVSKHKDRPYRAGRSPHWVKVKNREHPAMSRVMDTFS